MASWSMSIPSLLPVTARNSTDATSSHCFTTGICPSSPATSPLFTPLLPPDPFEVEASADVGAPVCMPSATPHSAFLS
eukprot:CAMPEP_0114148840 /NCGR_PEP_ID=MMETSP0043_2-20121206/21842_1 /TAXON_ID=464988 /ORGANISM="Hemiselmis andersenii, Strain CCMP644" /LENGTH=77 /DNA_ID=CAMNT_0001243447 /DNA_START=173 /DNA_END=406 /DNA_ORIENTATION=-